MKTNSIIKVDITKNGTHHSSKQRQLASKTITKLTDKKMDQMLLQLRELISDNNTKHNHHNVNLQKMAAVQSQININQKVNQNHHNQQKLLTSQNNRHNSINQDIILNNKKDVNIQQIIKQSSRLLQTRKQFQLTKPSIKGKIMVASQLLREQKDMIKSYVKEKIQSELFSTPNTNSNTRNKQIQKASFLLGQQQHQDQHLLANNNNNPQITDHHLLRLQEQRQQLIAQKRRQYQKQALRRQQLISQVRQFQSDSRVNVDIHEINSLIYKQQPQSMYLVNNINNSNSNDINAEHSSNGKFVKSRSNQVKSSALFISEVYDQHYIQTTSRIKQTKCINQDDDGELQFVEVHDDVQTSKSIINHVYNQQLNDFETNQLTKYLNKHTHLVKIFYQFIKNQYAIIKLKAKPIKIGSSIEQNYQSNLSSSSQPKQKNKPHQWKNKKIKPISISNMNKSSQKQKQNISTISQQYKFKPFSINDQAKIQYQRQKISQRRINKMIGESSKFHVKKCILTKNQLIYYQQKQATIEDTKFIYQSMPESTKFIQLQIQQISPQLFKKQQGSFFSKKQINTELVNVKGKARQFKFEYDFMEGRQLVGDLRKLMCAKVYNLGSKVNGANNLPLLHYVYTQKMQNFNLTQCLIPIENYLIKQDREKHINILIDSLTDHSQTTHINLKNTKLLSNEISLILKQSKKLQKLTSINLTNVRLGKQSFMEFCQFVNQIKTPQNGLQVILANCKLDDDCFMSNVGQFTSFCTKVNRLDISRNSITSKTIQIIKNCLQSATSIVKHLNISDCSIRDLTKLNALIKQSRKLQILQAQNCSLYFDQKRFEQMQKFFDFLKTNNNSNIKKINLCKNGALTRKEYTMIENLWYQENISQLVIDLDLEMLNDKGDTKQLLRTDNNNSNNKILNIKLYRKKQQNND